MIAVGTNWSVTDGNDERYEAFMTGWNSNHIPYVCMQKYWPAMARHMDLR